MFIGIRSQAQYVFNNNFDLRITYKVSFIGDSTVRTNVFMEDGYLFVNTKNNKSWFESSKYFDDKVTIDSSSKTIDRKNDGFRNLTASIAYEAGVLLTFDTYTIMIGNNAEGGKDYYVEPLNSLEWKILPDTLSMYGYGCQKAVLELGGRLWTACFTTDIPISDGPYKFKNLPGLVVHVADEREHWVFEFTSIQKLHKDFSIDTSPYKQYSKIVKDDFFKNKRYYEENSLEIDEASGKSFIDPENRKIMEQNRHRSFKSRSNWIELYPSY